MGQLINGVSTTPLKVIPLQSGNVLHALKASEPSFSEFGEAYFSVVEEGSIKGWKKHLRMRLNVIVPVGTIRFVLYDDRPSSQTYGIFNDLILGQADEYKRLTIEPEIWMAFQGCQEGSNILLNIASIEHDPTEVQSLPIFNDFIPDYAW